MNQNNNQKNPNLKTKYESFNFNRYVVIRAYNTILSIFSVSVISELWRPCPSSQLITGEPPFKKLKKKKKKKEMANALLRKVWRHN